jgi:hypothetical protein
MGDVIRQDAASRTKFQNFAGHIGDALGDRVAPFRINLLQETVAANDLAAQFRSLWRVDGKTAGQGVGQAAPKHNDALKIACRWDLDASANSTLLADATPGMNVEVVAKLLQFPDETHHCDDGSSCH